MYMGRINDARECTGIEIPWQNDETEGLVSAGDNAPPSPFLNANGTLCWALQHMTAVIVNFDWQSLENVGESVRF